MLGAIHKGRPRRGCEGGFRNLNNLGHRERGLIQQPENPSLKKTRTKNICFCGIIIRYDLSFKNFVNCSLILIL